MKPVKDSVAFVIYGSNRSQILVVQRPYCDEDLPGAWGLPAGSLKDGETFESAVLRAGRDKLGVELKVVKLINEGEIDRCNFLLHMKEYEKILKALANRRRLQIIKYLKDKKLATVTDISEHLKLSFKSTSKHLAVLFGVGILEKEQKSLSMFYSISDSLSILAKRVIDII